MAKVSLEFTGDEQDLTAALERMNRQLVKLQEQNQKLVQQSKQAAKEAKDANSVQDKMLDAGIAKVGAMAAGYLSLRGAINLVNAELERSKKLQADTAAAQSTIAAAERNLVINAGAISPGQRESLLGGVRRISQQNAVPLQQALLGAGAGIGFSGEIQPTLAALNVAARFNPYDVEALTPGLLATRNVTRSADARENLGFLISAQQYSPIKSTSLVTENLIPAAAGVRLAGDSDIEAASLVNALSFALADTTGQQSGTAAQRLAAVLAKQLPELPSTRARIDYLQQNPAAAKRAAAGIEQGATKAALVSLLSDPSSIANEKYRESLAGMAGAGGRVALAESTIANLEGTNIQQTDRVARGLTTTAEAAQFSNANRKRGRAGALRGGIDKVEDALGYGWFDQFLVNRTEDFLALAGFEAQDVQYARLGLAANVAQRQGNGPAMEALNQLVGEVRALRQEQPANTSRALRQNATNDLNTHTEGR